MIWIDGESGERAVSRPARMIHERCAFVHRAGRRGFLAATGFDTALRAILKASPGRVLSEGPSSGPESKPVGRTMLTFMNGPG